MFYADGAKDDKVNRINVTGNFLADNVTLILSTFDYVEGLTVDDYVEIEGELYLVTSVEIKGIARSEHLINVLLLKRSYHLGHNYGKRLLLCALFNTISMCPVDTGNMI